MPFPKFHMRVTYRTKHVWGRPAGKSHITAAGRAFCGTGTHGMKASPKPASSLCSICRKLAAKAGVKLPESA